MSINEVIKKDDNYFMKTFGKRIPVYFTHGKDVYLYDQDGKEYTDFLAGIAVNSLGYSDEGFKKVLHDCVDSFLHVSNYFYDEPQAELAEMLCKNTGYDRVFFSNSGAEANEAALKIAKKYHFDKGEERNHFVALKNSFHGRTIATLTATGQEKFHVPFAPLPYTFTYVDANDTPALKDAITSKTAGVIFEVVQGEGGVIPLEKEFVDEIFALCEKFDCVTICDEVQSGMGRCGALLAQDTLGVKADVTTLAKAIGNGIPIGAVMVKGKTSDVLNPGDHGSTFGGNHLACSAALYVVTKLTQTDIIKEAKNTGDYFISRLKELKDKFPCIKDVRGKGLLLGAEFDSSKNAADVKHDLFEKGFLACTAGQNTLRFLPPLIIRKENIDKLITALEEILNCQD